MFFGLIWARPSGRFATYFQAHVCNAASMVLTSGTALVHEAGHQHAIVCCYYVPYSGWSIESEDRLPTAVLGLVQPQELRDLTQVVYTPKTLGFSL